MIQSFIVIIAITNKYKRIFRNTDATAPERSIIPEEHGITRSLIFGKMLREGILCQVNNERFYLDERRDAAITNQRHKILKVIVIFLIVACVIGTIIKMV